MLKICLVSAEVAPLAKTGGLADVVAGLARYLVGEGHDVRVVMPLYRRVREQVGALERRVQGDRFTLREGRLPRSEVPMWFVEDDELFGGDSIYGPTDDHRRFGLLGQAALQACQRTGWAPDVMHCNDWHAALIPLYLRTTLAWDKLFAATRTLLTIHNIGYQGNYPAAVVDELGLGSVRHMLHQDELNAGRFGFLRHGVLYAHAITTVSRTYAHEILTPEFGVGLEGDLARRREVLHGIVNGIDYGDWNPAVDPHVAARYDADDLAGKRACKLALLERMNLAPDPGPPVIGIVSRLTWQKGFDLLPDMLPVLLRESDARLVVLGSGEDKYERYFQWLRDSFPAQVAVFRGFHEELAHQIEAGADLFLMPSRYEPCGLNQMYSLRYGTVPVVRRTGGLADTVHPYDEIADSGTGFTFDEFSAHALLAVLRYALGVYRDRPRWQRLMLRGMAEDFSWKRQGREYVALYRTLRG